MKRKVWVIEEIESDGQINHRQTETSYDLKEGDSWSWSVPDSLNDDQKSEWSRVLNLLKNVNGEDLRHVVCAAGLMTHCYNESRTSDYSNE
jgi:hypothetical protein